MKAIITWLLRMVLRIRRPKQQPSRRLDGSQERIETPYRDFFVINGMSIIWLQYQLGEQTFIASYPKTAIGASKAIAAIDAWQSCGLDQEAHRTLLRAVHELEMDQCNGKGIIHL